MVQVEFARPLDKDSKATKVSWVDASWNLKPGNLVTFKDEAYEWKVRQVYSTRIDMSEINTKWGLGLPKTYRTEK